MKAKSTKAKARAKARISLMIAASLLVAVAAVLAMLGMMHNDAALPNPSPSTEAEDTDGFPQVDWDYWQKINPAMIGWVTVPDTNINYPIAQASASDPTYYLTHDIYGKWNIYGCPYLDAECSEKGFESQNAVIFGHHMNNETMFSAFASYTSAKFAKTHTKILLQTPEKKMILKVSFSRICNAADTLKVTKFDNEATFAKWYKNERQSAAVKLNDALPSRTCTFVTCSYNRYANERTLVYTAPATTVNR